MRQEKISCLVILEITTNLSNFIINKKLLQFTRTLADPTINKRSD